MKKFFISLLVLVVLFGCGSGGGGSGDNRAEATTANALRAYDAMSIATYLPSLFSELYTKISNDGKGGISECNSGGDIKVTFLKEATGKAGAFVFDNCSLNIDKYNIKLNGKILAAVSTKSDESALFAFIKDGFSFKIDNDVSMKYGRFVFDAASDAVKPFNESTKGSFFTVAQVKNLKMISNHVRYTDDTLGDITYSGSFAKYDNFTQDGVTVNGVIAAPIGDDMINLFASDSAVDYDNRLLIYIDKSHYFETDIDKFTDIDELKTLLIGKADKSVHVWQDQAESVYAQTDDNYETSFTVHTPSF